MEAEAHTEPEKVVVREEPGEKVTLGQPELLALREAAEESLGCPVLEPVAE